MAVIPVFIPLRYRLPNRCIIDLTYKTASSHSAGHCRSVHCSLKRQVATGPFTIDATIAGIHIRGF